MSSKHHFVSALLSMSAAGCIDVRPMNEEERAELGVMIDAVEESAPVTAELLAYSNLRVEDREGNPIATPDQLRNSYLEAVNILRDKYSSDQILVSDNLGWQVGGKAPGCDTRGERDDDIYLSSTTIGAQSGKDVLIHEAAHYLTGPHNHGRNYLLSHVHSPDGEAAAAFVEEGEYTYVVGLLLDTVEGFRDNISAEHVLACMEEKASAQQAYDTLRKLDMPFEDWLDMMLDIEYGQASEQQVFASMGITREEAAEAFGKHRELYEARREVLMEGRKAYLQEHQSELYPIRRAKLR